MRGGWASLLAKISASKCFFSFAEQNLGFFFKFSLSFGLSSSFCNINFACLGFFMLVLMTHGVLEHIQHTMRQVASTRCTGRSLLEYRSDNWLQQHVGATCRSYKLLYNNNNNNFIYIALIS